MDLPNAGGTYRQERLGISAVQAYAAHQNQIWRETATGDVGIDGQLEFVDGLGRATGLTVALQVKTGPSYFQHQTPQGWKFYPELKHRNYWEAFPLPVLLVLHDPGSAKTYWTDARQALRTPGSGERAFIEVQRSQVLEESAPMLLFETTGVQSQPFIPDLSEVLAHLIATISPSGSFPVSYFDLFVQGLTNICRSIYYGMDAVCNAVEYNLAAEQSEFGMGLGDPEQEFAFGFVKFLLAQNLAQVDYADCLIDWTDRLMQPTFVAPLTSRGRKLVRLIHDEEQKLVAAGLLADEGGLHVAQEGFVHMVPESYFRRLPRIHAFQAAHRNARSGSSYVTRTNSEPSGRA